MSVTLGVRVIEWLNERHALLPFSQNQRDDLARDLDRTFANYQLVPGPKFNDVLEKLNEPIQGEGRET